ncbi:MAG TPA: ABC transporter ATP-binding protein [Spirochaetia bacterium]|nr:ABC transporter ATP-binding protein [Spirochaetia bacterium]
MTTDNAILTVRDLDVHYGDFHVLRSLSLDIAEQSVVSIMGANGAGKSTLLKALAGVLRPTAGAVRFAGRDISGLAAHDIVSAGISMVPEGARIFSRLTVLENLIIGSYVGRARRERSKVLQKVYELFPVLGERSNQLANSLSGGERQMLAIGRSLMSRPQLIFFDETYLGLAPLVVKDIYQRIKQINQEGVTVVLVDQDFRRSLRNSDFSYILLEGRVVLAGKSRELAEEDVRKAYFGI